MDANERRERFLLMALEDIGDPVKALVHARAMEDFIVNGLKQLRLLPPPREPAVPADKETIDAPPPPAKAEDAAAAVTPRKLGGRKAWSPAKVEEFKRMWRSDARMSDITARFNFTDAAAYQRAKKLGLGRRPKAKKRAATPTPPAPASPPDRPEVPSAESTPPARRSTPPHDTAGRPPVPRPAGPEQTNIEGVIRFLGSRDVHVQKDANSIKTPRWLVEGRRDQALNAEELISYANKERRRMGQPELRYGL